MNWLEKERQLVGSQGELMEKLRKERIVWDTTVPGELETLRKDVLRIAADMDSPERPPPMFWSGIPWPEARPEPSCGYQLVVSIGGTKTDFALLRLDKGKLIGLDVLSGSEVDTPDEIDRVKAATQMATPKFGPGTPTGQDMIAQMVAHLAPHVRRQREAFERCESILLSWGFPHRVIRTGPKLAGGLSARVTKMTKDQAEFTESLLGREIGRLLGDELEAQVGWSRPVAVANDTVMALHYFLDPETRSGHARVGLLINGTGTNFSAAEAYAVRPGGFISSGGEDYVPERITEARPLGEGEAERRFFVNYEAGSLDLVATRTRFDTEPDYPLERNALAGGNAFSQQLRAYVEEFVSRPAYEQLRRNWSASTRQPGAVPSGPAVSRLMGAPDPELLQGLDPEGETGSRIRLICQAIVARSALHAGLLLAAITHRTGFGTGDGSLPDLLGMEGSVWKTPGYEELVKTYWRQLVEPVEPHVEFRAESAFNASLSGPLYLAAIHR